MATAKYWVQKPPLPAVSATSPIKAYFVVVGLALGSLLVAAGAAMGYLAYFPGIEGVSVADAAGLPAVIVSLSLLGIGGTLVVSAFLICTCSKRIDLS